MPNSSAFPVPRLRPAMLLCLLVMLLPAAWAATALPAPLVAASPEGPLVVVVATPTSNPALAELLVRAFDGKAELDGRWKGAELSLNRQYAGYTRFERKDLSPGSTLLELSASGYRSRSFVLDLKGGMRYELQVPLETRKGWLAASLFPADAELIVGGARYEAGLIELREGNYQVQARRFGYEEESLTVQILDRLTTSLSVSLREAPFRAEGLEIGRSAFNPRNAGVIGRSSIAFRVSSYGSARLEISSAAGVLAYRKDFPSFDTWKQSAAWDGRLPDGSYAPDGHYKVRVEARAAPGLPAGQAAGATGPRGEGGQASFLLEDGIEIDSSLVVEPIGAAGGMPGLLFFADPRPLPPGTGAIDFSLFAALAETANPVMDLGMVLTVGRVALSLGGATGISGGSAESDRLTGGILLPLLPRASPIAAGLRLEAGYGAGTGAPPLAAAEGLAGEFSLPLSWSGGMLSLGLQPLAAARYEFGQGGRLAYGGRLALWTSSATFSGGFSGLWKAEVGGDWRLDAAVEARIVLGATPLTLHGGSSFGFMPGREPESRIFGSVGLLF